STNLKEILDIVLKEALQIIGLEGGTICLVEPDDTLKLISHVETSEATLKDFEENNIKVGDCLCGNCAHDNCPLILYNRSEVLKYASREVLQNEEINFHAAFPLTTKEKCVGVLCVFTRTDLKPAPRSLKLLETITSQVALAIENVLLVQDLENRVEDRTQQLIEVNKELETFTYSVSHDLKAPLRGIDGYSNLLQELYTAELNEEAKTFIEKIRNGTQQMNQIIEDLLAYSRLDRTLIKNTSARIDLFINLIIDLYQKELSDFNFKVENIIPSVTIVADLDGLSIAFRNIFDNAIKFTKFVDNPKITIELEEHQDCWHLLITDNGIGFDMKYYDKVFQIFQRLHRVEDYPGTGIGLAMVQKAMQRMGGKVWATSELGKGSVFYLEIPKNS
ncbi:MAG: ATP-binding protein, partial [Flavobacteriaceae bacterium]|nr:ATP-binding protein [Flavobacteriaceae bacterium]